MNDVAPSSARSITRGVAAGAGAILVAVLAAWAIGPAIPVGRTSKSATSVGHKAFALLLGELSFRVEPFERGVESLHRRRGVLVALEPGSTLFRARGRFARPLLDWIAEGNAALVTLGRDPDHAAEVDDRQQLLGDPARRALDFTREAEARRRDEAERPDAPATTTTTTTREEDPLADAARPSEDETWEGEVLLRFLDLPWIDARFAAGSSATPVALVGPLATSLDRSPVVALTRPRTFRRVARATTSTATALLTLEGTDDAVLLEVQVGRGRLLLLSEPRLLQNGALSRADHAWLGVRIVERLSRAAGGATEVAFEEWSHGGRAVSNVLDLATSSPIRWTLLQVVLASLAWIWMASGRRRSAVPLEVPPRRSRHEVIDAMASLFLRSGDVPGAERRLLRLSRLRLARALGMPAAAGDDDLLIVAVAERARRPLDEVRACLAGAPVRSQRELMHKAETLRSLRAALDVRR